MLHRDLFYHAGMPSNVPNTSAAGAGRLIAGVFGFAFLGIGLTVLGSLWLAPFDQFGSPPLFFRLFGSFIAIVFVAVGGATAWAAVLGKASPLSPVGMSGTAVSDRSTRSGPGSYVCPNCGAPLQAGVDVSPSGDVKCTFCNSWFNIHQPRT